MITNFIGWLRKWDEMIHTKYSAQLLTKMRGPHMEATIIHVFCDFYF